VRLRDILPVLLVAAVLTSPRPAAAEIASDLTRVVDLRRYQFMPDAIPGDGASTAHPQGTVLVVGVSAGATRTVLTERDVATGRIVRQVPLPLPKPCNNLGIVRAGHHIHIIGKAYDDESPEFTDSVWHVVLSGTLQVETVKSLGTGTVPRVASDGSHVAVTWSGRYREQSEFVHQLEMFDAAGRSQAHRALGKSVMECPYPSASLTVLDSHVYVTTTRVTNPGPGQPEKDTALLMKLDSSLNVEAQVDIGAVQRPLWALRGHLFVDTRARLKDPCARLGELSPSDLHALAARAFRPAALGQGQCPRPDEMEAPRTASDPAQSPVEYGFLSQFSLGEALDQTLARSLFVAGAPAVLEYEEVTGVTWLRWTAPPGEPAAKTAAAAGLSPTVHDLAFPNVDSDSVVPGEAPNADHPRGIVYTLRCPYVPPDPQAVSAVSGWDVATGARIVQAGLPANLRSCRMVFAGDGLHLFALAGEALHHLRLTSNLAVQSDEIIGQRSPTLVLADGSTVVAVASCAPGESCVSRVYIVDSSSASPARLDLEGIVQSVAIREGHVFAVESVAHTGDDGFVGATLRLVKADGRGRVETAVPLPAANWDVVVSAPQGLLMIDHGAGRVHVLRPSDLGEAGRLAYPYPGCDFDGACASFAMALGSRGRWVTSLGDVLGPDLCGVQHFATAPSAARAFWIGDEPAIVDWRAQENATHLRWLDP